MDESIKKADRSDFVTDVCETFGLEEQPVMQYSPLALAYIGDGIYDLVIRTMILERGNAKANLLHRQVSEIVKASAQAEMIRKMEPILTEEEKSVYRRGRNAKSYTKAKNASVSEYRHATGFEALMGYLYLNHQMDRLMELVKYGLLEEREECTAKN